MTTGCYRTSFLLFANARGAGTLLTAKCPAFARGCVLPAGIDSHVRGGRSDNGGRGGGG